MNQANIDSDREALREALNDLEDRVNPSKIAARAKEQVKAKLEEDPTPWIAAAGGIVVLIAGVITLSVLGRR